MLIFHKKKVCLSTLDRIKSLDRSGLEQEAILRMNYNIYKDLYETVYSNNCILLSC
jgi:hypothetical protein